MSDLISRKDLYQVMTTKSMELFDKGFSWAEFRRGFDFAMQFVIDAPSAEPEQKIDKWLLQPSTKDERPFIWWKCSECGQVIYSETERDRRDFHAYCGRCGTKMENCNEN